MPSNIVVTESGFKIGRALQSLSKSASGVDPGVKEHLDKLNSLLGKKVFAHATPTHKQGNHRKKGGAKSSSATDDVNIQLKDLVNKELTPARVNSTGSNKTTNSWKSGSVAQLLDDASENDGAQTISDCVNSTPELVELSYSFQEYLNQNWKTLSENLQTVLDLEAYPNIRQYLVSLAFYRMNFKDVHALSTFILKDKNGAQGIISYATVSATRLMICKQQLNVVNFNDDSGKLTTQLRKATIPLSKQGFAPQAKKLVQAFMFDSDEMKLINESTVGKDIPEDYKPALVKFIQASDDNNIVIDASNINFYLPVWLSQISYSAGVQAPDVTEPIVDDQEFLVQFHDSGDPAVSDISRSAVRCAAMLYHGMVVGDELNVFDAVNYFTHKFLIRGSLELHDKRLRQDLRQYVFSEKFVDLKNNQIMDRTRPSERQMFYRQVFNEGSGQVTEDVLINLEFRRLWKLLMLESAKYLQRAQASLNPDSYVSPQNVMQAIEDLQYNLSINCTGMVNVIAPLIDAELNFVITRILQHQEVIRNVVPMGGGWQRVVEALSSSMRRSRQRATTVYNKARLGESIIRSIAAYTPADFENQDTFLEFISKVDAYITTQSILQESLTDSLVDEDNEEDEYGNQNRDYLDDTEQPALRMGDTNPGEKAAAAAGGDEWDF